MMNVIRNPDGNPGCTSGAPRSPTAAHLVELDAAIARTRLVLVNLRVERDAHRRRLARLRTERDRVHGHLDARFVANMNEPVYRSALEDALSGDGPLDQKLANGMRLVAETPHAQAWASPDPDEDDDDEKDPDDDDSVLRFENEGGRCNPACTCGAPAEPDGDFADRVVQEATDEVNAALAAAREEEAMNAIHGGHPGDESYCDANGQA